MRRIAIVLGSAAVMVLLMALPASAHVSIQPSTATKGSFATIAFQVPNEEQAKTVKVQVKFPEEPAIADAAVQPVPGWKVAVKKAALSPPITTDEGTSLNQRLDTLTWTADDGKPFPSGQHVVFTHWSVGGTDNAASGGAQQVGVWQYCSSVSGAALKTFMLDYPFSDSPEPNGM